ncbi:hypothetical protein Q73_13020 [Bacillus coahuilensis m2-6]|nr:hypothetical protein Q73_13020 [Bacillus coahuilensis m2-6]
MVMGQATYSKIFLDMLVRFEKNLKKEYLIVVTDRSIKKADVYHYWRPNASVKDIKSPSIVTVHHDFDRDTESLSLRHFIDAYQKADIILCLNYNQKNRLEEHLTGKKDIRVIPHGYDQNFTPKLEYKENISHENKLVIGFSSRRYNRLIKGEETLYKIINNLQGQPVKFIFIGQDRRIEHEYCENVGIESEYYETIPYHDYPKLYYRMDLFIITSNAEGGPASLPEALATGLPVVSTPCGFVPDLIKDGVNGYIVDYGDSQVFTDRILKFINQPDLIAKLGKNATQTKELKTWEEIINDYNDVYKDITK